MHSLSNKQVTVILSESNVTYYFRVCVFKGDQHLQCLS